MLISPVRVYDLLSALLEADEERGPHTALLITPAGQLLSHATLPEDADEDDGEGDEDGDEDEGDGGDEDGEGAAGAKSKCDAGDDEGDEDEEDEPWLEGPERLRLLLGLASQWEEDASPRVECEVSIGSIPLSINLKVQANTQLGRLFLRPIALPEQEVVPSNAPVPIYPKANINSFVLVLNGTSDTPWTELASKVGFGFDVVG